MGKAGKERKRRKLERDGFGGDDGRAGADHDDDDEDNEQVDGDDGDPMALAIAALDVLGQHPALYRSKAMKTVRAALFPLIDLQVKKRAHFEAKVHLLSPVAAGDATVEVPPAQVDALLHVVAALTNDTAQFLSVDCKELRHALHPLVLLAQRKDSPHTTNAAAAAPSSASASASSAGPTAPTQSYTQRISTSFRAGQWAAALKELHAMRVGPERPKLGTIQRWIRDCDLARAGGESDGENTSWLLLDATMRLQGPPCPSSSGAGAGAGAGTVVEVPRTAVVTRHPVFSPPAAARTTTAATTAAPAPAPASAPTGVDASEPFTPAYIRARLSVLAHVPGPQRRPPSTVDLHVYQLAARTVPLDHSHSHSPTHTPAAAAAAAAVPARRVDVPHLPGVFLLENVLTKGDCDRLIAAAESIGYVPDAVEGIDNLQLYADDTLLQPVFERCRALLPPTMGGPTGRLVGINARWRLFRYYEQRVYRPHIDGAWPGSGIDPVTGAFVDDIYHGKCVSKLTFLVYLNGADADADADTDVGKGGAAFAGGSTTFYQPDKDSLGHIHARSVQPKTGAVLCFPHGDIGSLVHEGSAVVSTTGVKVAKYVIRSDVIYEAC